MNDPNSSHYLSQQCFNQKNASDIWNYMKTPSFALVLPVLGFPDPISNNHSNSCIFTRIKVYQIFIHNLHHKERRNNMCHPPDISKEIGRSVHNPRGTILTRFREQTPRFCPVTPPPDNGRNGPMREQPTDANSDSTVPLQQTYKFTWVLHTRDPMSLATTTTPDGTHYKEFFLHLDITNHTKWRTLKI